MIGLWITDISDAQVEKRLASEAAKERPNGDTLPLLYAIKMARKEAETLRKEVEIAREPFYEALVFELLQVYAPDFLQEMMQSARLGRRVKDEDISKALKEGIDDVIDSR
jgi:hypothetical protein